MPKKVRVRAALGDVRSDCSLGRRVCSSPSSPLLSYEPWARSLVHWVSVMVLVVAKVLQYSMTIQCQITTLDKIWLAKTVMLPQRNNLEQSFENVIA